MFSYLSLVEKADVTFKVSLAWMIQVLLGDGQVRGGETDAISKIFPLGEESNKYLLNTPPRMLETWYGQAKFPVKNSYGTLDTENRVKGTRKPSVYATFQLYRITCSTTSNTAQGKKDVLSMQIKSGGTGTGHEHIQGALKLVFLVTQVMCFP